jgi:hypothetical protein
MYYPQRLLLRNGHKGYRTTGCISMKMNMD